MGFSADEGREEKHSRVTFDIEPLSDTVRLTVTHEQLEPGSEMLHRITQVWPAVLSSLKTLLETGRPLPAFKWYCRRSNGNFLAPHRRGGTTWAHTFP